MKWEKWFAWYPVRLNSGQLAWARTIEWNLTADPTAPFTRVRVIYR